MDNYSTHAAICPYCGHENDACDSDGMLYDEGIGEYECGDWGWPSQRPQMRARGVYSTPPGIFLSIIAPIPDQERLGNKSQKSSKCRQVNRTRPRTRSQRR